MLTFRTIKFGYGAPTQWGYVIYWPGQIYPRVTRPQYRSETEAADEAWLAMEVVNAYPGLMSNDIAQERKAVAAFLFDRRLAHFPPASAD